MASTNVEQDSMIFFYDPRPDWVTGILCVDMDCDGLKHSMIVDFNGTFFGSNGVPTTAIPDASINFNPNFVPVIMRTNLDGSIMELDQLYNNTGIYTDGCVWMESWNAYSCPQTSYNLLVIESMDADSLTRRLSPVALMAVDENAGNYLNLLNGPKQVGWCAHYACLKRPSTFYGVVAQNLTYRVALTGTNPSSMRLWNLYAQDSDSVKLVIDWPTSQRLDVYCNSALVLPTDQNVTHQYGENLSVYDPSITTATSGAHFYRIDLEQLTVIIKGSAPILIQSSPAVLIALGITSPNADAFFDTGSLISNLAAFLGINPITLKIVNIVPETVTTPSKNRFAKRITSTKWNIKIQIANPPASTLTSSMTTTTTMTTKMSLTTSTGVSTASNVVSTTSVSSSSSPTPSSNSTTDAGNQNLNTAFNQQVQQYAQQVQQQTALANLASNLVSAFQSNMQNILPNATISSLSVQLPPAPAVPPIPPTVSANSSVAQILTNLTMQDLNVSSSSNSSSSSSSSSPLSFQIPSQMVAQTTIQGTIMYQLPTLVFQVLDSSGNLVHNLGLANSQWKLQAYLFTSNTSSLTNSSGGSIKLSSSPIVNVTNLLIGTTLQSFVGGKATFNDLSISSSGDGFSLAFVPFSGSSSMSSFYYATGSFSFIAPSSPSGTGGGGATTSPTGSSSSPLSSTGFPLYGIIIVTVVGALVIGSLAAFVTVKRKREARRQLKGKGKMVEPRDSFEPTAKNNIRAESSAAQVPVIRTSQVSVDEMDKSAEHLASPIASQAILVSFYEAIEPYTPDILFQDELAIKTGDIIQVISSSSDKVWYVGHSLTSNKSGRFPIRCVKVKFL